MVLLFHYHMIDSANILNITTKKTNTLFHFNIILRMWHTYDKIHVREKTGTTLLVAGIATNIEQLARIDSIYNKH